MESFAFWYHEKQNHSQDTIQEDASQKSSSPQELSAVMNFNLWCECGWNRKTHNFHHQQAYTAHPFLDIGFRIKNLNLADEILFFIPLHIDEQHKCEYIEDLGHKYKQTPLVDATFNQSYETTVAAGKKTISAKTDARNSGKEDSFKIYQLDIEHDIMLQPFSDGTIISIKTSEIFNNQQDATSDNEDYYFRFRIKECPLDFLIHHYSPPYKAVQSIFTTTYMIDFRHQNIRSLQNTLIERFNSGGNHIVNVTKLHFLLITKAYVDVTFGEFKDIRKIEPQVWEDYVDNYDTTDLVAYHYVNKPGKDENDTHKEYIQSSELFLKFKLESSITLPFILATISLGALGSMLASLISNSFNSFSFSSLCKTVTNLFQNFFNV